MQQKVRVCVSVSIVTVVLIVLLLNLTGRNDAASDIRSQGFTEDMLKILTNLRNDHLCKVKNGYESTYLDVLNVCMSCTKICDETSADMKELCTFGCQEYMILQNVEEIVHKTEKTETKPETNDDGLVNRITELESFSLKFKVLEDLKNRMDVISQMLTDNETKLKKEISRVENVQGSMIEELQDAMDAIEKWQRYLFIGLAFGCIAMIGIIGLTLYLFSPTNSHSYYRAVKHQP